jgi:hypothetical protein
LIGADTVICIENHYLGAVLDRFQFDTFYHEHPRTYSLGSFDKLAPRLGLDIAHFEFPARYGGNIRVFLAPGTPSAAVKTRMANVLSGERGFPERLRGLAPKIDEWVRYNKQKVARLIDAHGKLYAKAFPGRAAILVKMLGLTTDHIMGVCEKPGSMKIGHYVPGTRIPIISDDEFFRLRPQPAAILNFAWHIPDEIRAYMASSGFHGEIVDLLDPSTFPR